MYLSLLHKSFRICATGSEDRIVKMNRLILILIITLILSSCTPVLKKDLLLQGTFTRSLSEVTQNPVNSKGKLFIFGGIIVKTTVTKDGSLIEAIHVPVTGRGYLKSVSATSGRFLALFRNRDILDPLIFSEKREITIAGEFTGTRKGSIDEAEYTYPLFEIREVYLWPKRYPVRDHYYWQPYYGPAWYYRDRHHRPWYYDPWRPWPYY